MNAPRESPGIIPEKIFEPGAWFVHVTLTVSVEVQSEVNDEPAVSVVQSGVNEQEADEPIVGHAATRKRLRKEPVWKSNKRKNARTHSLPYTNTVGRQIEGKQLVLQECLCTAKCRWNCSDDFSEADR